ncbi:MAG: hypothetical protein ABIZ69_05015 [Ilumatobacteraceae bacterium]
MRRWLVFALLVGVVVAVSIGFSPDGSTSSVSPATTTANTGTFFPTSRAQLTNLRQVDSEAIVALGATGAGIPASNQDHNHTESFPEVALSATDAPVFASQWSAAQNAIAAHDTEAEATALGYVRATAPSAGIGTHWVLWSQIAKPFDPAVPSMLLFDERRTPPVLVGYSYALSSPTLPEGFAGPNDHWHQHRGLCVDGGWVVREQAAGAEACSGTYIAGGDFWMLHAWVVPGWDNRKGEFAPFNPKLCPSNVGTPDVNRCPT